MYTDYLLSNNSQHVLLLQSTAHVELGRQVCVPMMAACAAPLSILPIKPLVEFVTRLWPPSCTPTDELLFYRTMVVNSDDSSFPSAPLHRALRLGQLAIYFTSITFFLLVLIIAQFSPPQLSVFRWLVWRGPFRN